MKEHTKIFISQEFKTILGKRGVNFWILFIVFVITVGSLSFSRAGLGFLEKKMNNPFIKWIEVKEQGRYFDRFKDDIEKIKKDSFDIESIEANNYILEYVFKTDFTKHRVEGRTISHDSKLLKKILDNENTVVKRQNEEIGQNDYGWIVTKDLMKNLGYDDENNYPLFINYTFPGDKEKNDRLGIKNNDDFIIIPIPVIAVVNQLPDLLDFITSSYFKQQLESSTNPFNISYHSEYYKDLILAVENSDEEVEDNIRTQLDRSGLQYDWENGEDINYSIRTATKYRIIIRDSLFITKKLNDVAEEICKDSSIYRIYNYDFDKGKELSPNYLSFMLNDLSKVPDLAKFAKQYGIRIDMAQIEAKNNFNEFNKLANGLCIAIIAISFLFVLIFLGFLINTHFQKISKNLGTIMAFGLENSSIMRIYLAVFMLLVVCGLAATTVLLLATQYAFHFFGLLRENAMPYLNMHDYLVLAVLLGIVVLSALVTFFAMKIKLKATPGDLIFERN